MATVVAPSARYAEDLAPRLRGAIAVVASGAGAGTGTAWRHGPLIVTNSHVVADRQARVETAGGRIALGEVIARDAEQDLALLWAETAGLEPLPIRDARSLRPGELVFATGNPWGQRGVLTAGVVIAAPPARHRLDGTLREVVLSDVRLAPGNSGGPLVDAAGRVVGINTMVSGGLAIAVSSEQVEAFVKSALASWQQVMRKRAV